ncbi:MAG TPA: CvpA family protein [Candidatus Dormibacteraeota bacterium]|nr:CvpA family protein [Candidatus Dormibacteraeota bacterium]
MSWLDVLPILLIAIYAVLGYFFGVLRRGIGVVALYVAFLAATGMGLQAGNILQQATSLETPDARIFGFFGLLFIVLILVEGAAQLANAQIQITAIVWNRMSGLILGILTGILLSVLVVYEFQAAGSPSGGGALDDNQARIHDSVQASHIAVPIVNAIYKPVVAIFQPVLPSDPHQYFSRGPVS